MGPVRTAPTNSEPKWTRPLKKCLLLWSWRFITSWCSETIGAMWENARRRKKWRAWIHIFLRVIFFICTVENWIWFLKRAKWNWRNALLNSIDLTLFYYLWRNSCGIAEAVFFLLLQGSIQNPQSAQRFNFQSPTEHRGWISAWKFCITTKDPKLKQKKRLLIFFSFPSSFPFLSLG